MNENIWIFNYDFISNQQYSSIGSDNGWTNDGPVYWRIYLSLGLNELNQNEVILGHVCSSMYISLEL